jgi:hypothetical protein
MSVRQISPLLLELNAEGGLKYVGFRDTPLDRAVSQPSSVHFDTPFRLRTGDTAAELYSLKHATRKFRWLDIESPTDVPGSTGFDEIMSRVESRHSTIASPYANYYRAILSGPASPQEVLETFELVAASGPSKERSRALLAQLERAIGRHAIVVDLDRTDAFFAMLLTAVWLKHGRRFPLLLAGDRGIPLDVRMSEFAGSIATFENLVAEIHRVIGTPAEEIEKAYRVWQISRRPSDPKPRATTPKYITVGTATAFLRVFARARTDRELSQAAVQRPAPLMFDLQASAVGLRQGAATADSPQITAAAASSLMRSVERLQDDHSLSNLVPSAGAVLETVLAILVQVQGATHSEGDVVELGMELNTLQWHIDSVRDRIGEATLGELTGLFSSSQMLLSRFRVWREFEATSRYASGRDTESYDIAVGLLEEARNASSILSIEADHRIHRVLGRAAEAGDGGQQEGVVRSGENLAAITVEHVARQTALAARGLADAEPVSEAMAKFVADNAAGMQRLAVRRNRPWLRWLQGLRS